ncbi:hypothetical protein BF49_3891 [Bradyrhizobium sp.]|nr:hypothetical protein BF49_3891 [Bradyrhizobium sp.]
MFRGPGHANASPVRNTCGLTEGLVRIKRVALRVERKSQTEMVHA